MMSEGIHSLVDTGNQGLLLYGLKRAKKPASPDFPFGHGKEIYFWSFVVAILIFAVGAGISMYEGFHHILHPEEMSSPYINYIVLSLAMIFEAGALYIAYVEFNKSRGELSAIEAVKRGKDPTLFVVLFEDSAAMAGLIFAFAGVALAQITGNPIWDGIASVVIGVILAITAFWLAYETKGLLIGESAGKGVTDKIRNIAQGKDGVKVVNEILSLHMGPEFILVNISIDFKDELQAGKIEQIIHSIDRDIKTEFPFIKRIFVEAEASKKTV